MSAPRVQYVPVMGNRLGPTAAWPGEWHGAALVGHRSRGIAWRVLGANNRELGRSADSFIDEAACQHDWQCVQANVDTCARTIVASSRGACWVWRLAHEGRVVAVSSRPYQRQRECEYNLLRFTEMLPLALADCRPDALLPSPSTSRLESVSP